MKKLFSSSNSLLNYSQKARAKALAKLKAASVDQLEVFFENLKSDWGSGYVLMVARHLFSYLRESNPGSLIDIHDDARDFKNRVFFTEFAKKVMEDSEELNPAIEEAIKKQADAMLTGQLQVQNDAAMVGVGDTRHKTQDTVSADGAMASFGFSRNEVSRAAWRVNAHPYLRLRNVNSKDHPKNPSVRLLKEFFPKLNVLIERVDKNDRLTEIYVGPTTVIVRYSKGADNASLKRALRSVDGIDKAMTAMGAEEAISHQPSAIRFKADGLGPKANKGGIDLNPALLDLQIRYDDNGQLLPLNQQPLMQMKIEGFIPVIINVTPVYNLPLLLGWVDEPGEETEFSYQQDMNAIEPQKITMLN